MSVIYPVGLYAVRVLYNTGLPVPTVFKIGKVFKNAVQVEGCETRYNKQDVPFAALTHVEALEVKSRVEAIAEQVAWRMQAAREWGIETVDKIRC